MSFDSDYEQIRDQVTQMDRRQLTEKILHFEGHLKLDFTEPFLNGLREDKLRHILLAAYLIESRHQPI